MGLLEKFNQDGSIFGSNNSVQYDQQGKLINKLQDSILDLGTTQPNTYDQTGNLINTLDESLLDLGTNKPNKYLDNLPK